MMLTSVLILSLLLGSSLCQRYAERNPFPVADPFPSYEKAYEDNYSEGYDFDDNIYRWNVEEFPHPQRDFQSCNRMKSSFICDPDKVLDIEPADNLDSYIGDMYRGTRCICDKCNEDDGGVAVGIALLKHMYQPYNEHPTRIIRSFAERLRERWNLGKCDNDILIVVATTDRLLYTDVGEVTATYVSREEAHRIFLANRALFGNGSFYEGLSALLTNYRDRTRDMRGPVQEELNAALISGYIIGAVALLALILTVVFFTYRYCKKKKAQGKQVDATHRKSEGVSSSWSKQDIEVMFSPLKSHDKSDAYQPCETEDHTLTSFRIEEEVIDTTLATLDGSSEASTMLDKELTEAVEGLPLPKQKKHETDL